MSEIVDRIRELRFRYKMSEADLAHKIGVSQAVLNYQNKGGIFSSTVLFAIAENMPEVSMEWLMRGEGNIEKSVIPTETDSELVATLQDTIKVYNKYFMSDKNRQKIDKKNLIICK